MPGELIRVVLADDHSVVRGLKAVLGAAPDIEVIGEASDGREALALAERLKPDVIVMDLWMEGMGGTEAMRELVARKFAGKLGLSHRAGFVHFALKLGLLARDG